MKTYATLFALALSLPAAAQPEDSRERWQQYAYEAGQFESAASFVAVAAACQVRSEAWREAAFRGLLKTVSNMAHRIDPLLGQHSNQRGEIALNEAQAGVHRGMATASRYRLDEQSCGAVRAHKDMLEVGDEAARTGAR